MTTPVRRADTRLAIGLAVAMCAILGCGDGSGIGAGGVAGGGATRAGGAGGQAPVEGCVAIFGGPASLPDAEQWSVDFHVPGREPFWVDEGGVHYAWTANHPGEEQSYLLISTFDAESGHLLANRVLDPFPAVRA